MKATPANKRGPVLQSIPVAAVLEASVEPDVVGTVNVAVTVSKSPCHIKQDADEINGSRRIACGRCCAH